MGDIFWGGGNLLGLSGMKAAAFTPACAPPRPPMPTGSTVKPELPAAGSWGVTSDPPPRFVPGWSWAGGMLPVMGTGGPAQGFGVWGCRGAPGRCGDPLGVPLVGWGAHRGPPHPGPGGLCSTEQEGCNPPSLSWGGVCGAPGIWGDPHLSPGGGTDCAVPCTSEDPHLSLWGGLCRAPDPGGGPAACTWGVTPTLTLGGSLQRRAWGGHPYCSQGVLCSTVQWGPPHPKSAVGSVMCLAWRGGAGRYCSGGGPCCVCSAPPPMRGCWVLGGAGSLRC